MKAILSLFFLLAMGAMNLAQAQDTQKVDAEQIVVRFYETGALAPSEAVISYSDGTHEVVDMKSLTGRTKNWEENAKIINEVLNRLRKQGYTLISSVGGGPDMMLSTYVFLRDDLVK
ncbi:MAG: hypothetical protein EA392_08955 [Cryomorphaceae bacterium]|nr:MAG: hypothetical protein EA392_08955 [Cryomorphaceae bacterium]